MGHLLLVIGYSLLEGVGSREWGVGSRETREIGRDKVGKETREREDYETYHQPLHPTSYTPLPVTQRMTKNE
jgi:hypothetical protein